MVRVEHLHFPLAKVLYDSFHRTNKPPVGHKQSFILIKDTGSYEPVSNYDWYDDLFTNWFEKAYPNNYDGDDFSELKSVISNQQQGFIAQEVKQAAFETNSSNTDFGGFVEVNITDEDQKIKDETGTTDDIHKLDYQQFVPPLVKAVQQLSAKIDVLEARIDELEGT